MKQIAKGTFFSIFWKVSGSNDNSEEDTEEFMLTRYSAAPDKISMLSKHGTYFFVVNDGHGQRSFANSSRPEYRDSGQISRNDTFHRLFYIFVTTIEDARFGRRFTFKLEAIRMKYYLSC